MESKRIKLTMRTEDQNLIVPVKSLDYATVTEEIWKKAKEELGETDETRAKCLAELRILLKGEKELIANTSDEFLIQFLRAKKFKPKSAFATVKKFYGHRILYPTFYHNFAPSHIVELMKTNLFNFLPLRTPDDCAVWLARVGSWDPKDFDFDAVMKIGVTSNMKELQNPVTQISGVVNIVDLKGFSLAHMLCMSPTMIKCFVGIVQDGLPIRHKAIHVINNPSIFGILFAILKPLITPKIRKRIYFHGYDLNSLHQYVPACILPEECGGTQGPFKNEQFYSSLLESDEAFLEDQKYGYRKANQ